jgi:hypothetical protein
MAGMWGKGGFVVFSERASSSNSSFFINIAGIITSHLFS